MSKRKSFFLSLLWPRTEEKSCRAHFIFYLGFFFVNQTEIYRYLYEESWLSTTNMTPEYAEQSVINLPKCSFSPRNEKFLKGEERRKEKLFFSVINHYD
jgi:hypothetical protein